MATSYLYAKPKERKLWLSSIMFYVMMAQIFCALVMDVFDLVHIGYQLVCAGFAGVTVIGAALGVKYRDGFLPPAKNFDFRYFWYMVWMVVIGIAYWLEPGASTQFFLGIDIPKRVVFLVTVSVMLLFSLVFTSADYKTYTKYLTAVMIVVTIVNFIFMIRAVYFFPNAIRAQKTAELHGYGNVLFGLPAYAIVYAFSVLSPAVFSFFIVTKGDIYRKYAAIMAAIVFVSIMISQYATATIGMIVAIPMILVLRQKKTIRWILMVMLIAVTIILIYSNGMAQLLLFLEKLVPDQVAWNEKLIDMAEGFMGSEQGILQSREQLYLDSWNTFKTAPLFGAILEGEPFVLGGHSTFFDMLATVGIFGTVPFIMFIFESYRHSIRQLKTREAVVTVQVGYIIFLIFFIFKNMITSHSIFVAAFIVLPILAQRIDDYAVEKYEDEKGYFDENDK